MEEESVADQSEVDLKKGDTAAAPAVSPAAKAGGENRVPIMIGIGVVAALVLAATVGVLVTGDTSPKSAGDSAVELCKEAITDKLKDPSSAQFGAVTAGDEKQEDGARVWEVAGTVNAKNSYGGYVGSKPFICTATVLAGSDSMTATASILD
ncbi:hypothetical protein [Tsukamurella tyrosinosolvens]|uniref:hypothetical protein n=1 Tax=Tsukamurella tyrosinosolvens TaxID=57704 RepID=UPI002DD43651|nr:hypothetical protein [Tsukamurella tyrosinosolvens]MEC4616190.1 hypothetical protein [Tsukamurella tyrosinosolvens]